MNGLAEEVRFNHKVQQVLWLNGIVRQVGISFVAMPIV